MGIKQFLKEKKELIKTNRRLIALGCGVSAIMVAIPSITGVVTAHNKKEKVQQYYEYAKPVKPTFDENNKLIIPTIIDKDNLTGNYEHKVPTITDTKVPDNIKQSTYYKQGLPKLLNENKQTLHTQIKEYANFKVDTNKDLILLLDNILPNHNIKEGQEINVSQICDSIYETATLRAKDNILSNQEISDLCALNGLSFDKEYNNVLKNIENQNIRGGAGAKPPSMQIPDLTTNYGEVVTVRQAQEIYKQDSDTRMCVAIAHSAISLALFILQAILTYFTFGLTVISFIIDLTFCLLEIAMSWVEFDLSNQLLNYLLQIDKNYLDEMFREVINYGVDIFGQKYFKNKFLFKLRGYNKEIINNIKTVSKSFSWYALAAKVVITILFEVAEYYILKVVDFNAYNSNKIMKRQ